MKLSPSACVGLVIALFFSLLFNAVALLRSSSEPPQRAPAFRFEPAVSRPLPARAAAEPEAPSWSPAAEAAPARPEPQVRASKTAESATAPAGGTSYVKLDPKVAGVLDAQEKFGKFWKDLDRVIKAKDRLEPETYFQAVSQATTEFLELSEAQRGGFVTATRAAIDSMAQARRERDQSRALLPPKDKNNSATYAVYQQQKDAVDARYQAQNQAAVELLKGQLDPRNPRHSEFLQKADSWVRNLVPKSVP
jgi:hypothetical protein